MENHNEAKMFLVIGIIVLIGGFFYFSSLNNPRTTPIQVFIPSGLPSGTTVSMYSDAPAAFPKETILENKTLTYSGAVTGPDGRTQIKVSYISDRTSADVANLYQKGLPSSGWNATMTYLPHGSVIINSRKGAQNLLITITVAQDITKSVLTFQYQE